MNKRNEATPMSPEATQAMFSFNGQSIDTFFNAYGNWFNEWSRVQDESLKFVRNRLARSVDAATNLAACKTPAEALAVQMTFTREAISDYVAEGQKMVALLNPAMAQAGRAFAAATK